MEHHYGRLSIHHIGGRSGTREFPLMEAFEQDLLNVLYDADESCIDAIVRATRHLKSKTVVLPRLIGGRSGQADFFITGNRYASSLLKISPERSAFYSYDLNFAWDNDPESFRIDETLHLPITSLDDIYNDCPKEALPPDFLSIDAEGAEMDILKGAQTLLARKIICIKAEVSIIPFRERQKLFSDVQTFLEEKHFSLIDLTLFRSDAKYHEPLPIGLRGHGIHGCGDALFFKKGTKILIDHKSPFTDLVKGAFIAISLCKFEVAHGYLDLWKKHVKDPDHLTSEFTYIRFIKEFIRIRDTYPRIFPIRFSTVFPTPLSRKKRFQDDSDQPDKEQLRRAYFQEVHFDEFREHLPVIFSATPIGIEDLCLKYGLNEQAAILREKRHQQVIGLLNRLGFLARDGQGNFLIDHEAISSYERASAGS